jgi:hypothetical protein
MAQDKLKTWYTHKLSIWINLFLLLLYIPAPTHKVLQHLYNLLVV